MGKGAFGIAGFLGGFILAFVIDGFGGFLGFGTRVLVLGFWLQWLRVRVPSTPRVAVSLMRI